jgi:lysozyme
MTATRTSDEGRRRIKLFEEGSLEPKLRAYADPASGGEPWTIGWGSTRGVTKGMVISREEAERRFETDIANAERLVRAYAEVPLTQGQFDALVSFVFNVGAGRLGVKDGWVVLKNGKPPTLRRKLNAGDYAGAAGEFAKWVYGSGKRMPGLVTRRAAEAGMFVSGMHVASNTVEAQPAEVKPPGKDPETVGAVTAGAATVATIGATLMEAGTQVQAASAAAGHTLTALKWAFAALILAGVIFNLVHRFRRAKREGQ